MLIRGNEKQEAESVRKRQGKRDGCFCHSCIQLFGEEAENEKESE